MAQPAAKLPANYRLLLDVVEADGHGTHRSTADIYDAMRRVKPGIGYSTVQRGLARLAALGLVMPVRLPNVEALLFEPAGSGHAHFGCESCGATIDVDYVTPAASLAAIARELGVSISAESIAFRGLCKACVA
jgi:Fe2+ or Zn2+ uptake regulation protein